MPGSHWVCLQSHASVVCFCILFWVKSYTKSLSPLYSFCQLNSDFKISLKCIFVTLTSFFFPMNNKWSTPSSPLHFCFSLSPVWFWNLYLEWRIQNILKVVSSYKIAFLWYVSICIVSFLMVNVIATCLVIASFLYLVKNFYFFFHWNFRTLLWSVRSNILYNRNNNVVRSRMPLPSLE